MRNRRSGGATGSGSTSLKRLRIHVDSCRLEYPTPEEVVSYLRDIYPCYRRMKVKELTRMVTLVSQSSDAASPSNYNRKKRFFVDDDNTPKQRKQTHESDESDSDSKSGTFIASSSGISTSEDAIYEEKVEPEFDVMQSLLRKTYADQEMKDVIETNGTSETKELSPIKESDTKEAKQELMREAAWPMLKDLGGLEKVKSIIEKHVLFPFFNFDALKRRGRKSLGGILLYGPPGCGKTTFANAIANQARVPFFSIAAPELVSGVSGASEKNIRELFSKAYKSAPSIIFIDEIDAIASVRDNLHKEMEKRIVNQLMTCMDEFQERIKSDSTGFVLVIGATNRVDAIDPALRRPGRFDREILLEIPDEQGRHEILQVLTKGAHMDTSIDLLKIARLTAGFVGADLNALVKEADDIALMRIMNARICKPAAEQCGEWYETPMSNEEMDKSMIKMGDFEEATRSLQPSLRREGFSSIPKVKWEDVGGLQHVRDEFNLLVIDRIKFPELYKSAQLDMDAGILLFGPPGCGKTLVAQAVANEAGANFIYVKGSEVLNKYVGESESAVRTLFKRARSCAPCIIFIDELDGLATARGSEGAWVVERVVNQLLIELDGVEDREGVFVIGATNRPQAIDPAILRSGRFDKFLYIPLPSAEDRGLILETIAKKNVVDSGVDLMGIARSERCHNFSGADLKNLFNRAVLTALKEAKDRYVTDDTPRALNDVVIKQFHFEAAFADISPAISTKQLKVYQKWYKKFYPGA